MAGSEQHVFILDIMTGEDDGEGATLADLAARVQVAIDSGLPRETRLQAGWSQDLLRDCIYFVGPVDVKEMSFDELRVRTRSSSFQTSEEAWAEIYRRLEDARLAREAVTAQQAENARFAEEQARLASAARSETDG